MSLRQHPATRALLLSGLISLALPMNVAPAADATATDSTATPTPTASAATVPSQPADTAPATVQQTRPKLVIIGLALDEKSEQLAEFLALQATKSASDSARFQIVHARDVLDPDGTTISSDHAQKATALVAQAREDYDNLELAEARAKSEEAIQLLQATDMSQTFGLYVEARKLLIASLLADSENAAADKLLKELLPQDLGSDFDPNLFSPDYIAQVNQQRNDLEKNARGSLDLTTQPSAQVFVDGVFQGVSPVELRNLTLGEHVLTLSAPGHKLLQKKFTPGTAGTLTEKLEPVKKGMIYKPFLKALKGKFSSEDRGKSASDLAKFLSADQLTVIAVQHLQLHNFSAKVIRIDPSDGHELSNSEFGIQDDFHTLETSSARMFTPLFAVDLPRGKGGKAVTAEVNPFYWRKRHTAFVLYGVAALGLGSGITFGVDAMQQANTYKDMTAPQNSPVYDRVETVGKRSALIADVSFGVAIAAVATGTALLIYDIVSGSGPKALGGEIEVDTGGTKAKTSRRDSDTAEKAWSNNPVAVEVESDPKDASKDSTVETSNSSSSSWDSDW